MKLVPCLCYVLPVQGSATIVPGHLMVPSPLAPKHSFSVCGMSCFLRRDDLIGPQSYHQQGPVGGAELRLPIGGPVIRGLLMGSSSLVMENYAGIVRAVGTRRPALIALITWAAYVVCPL